MLLKTSSLLAKQNSEKKSSTDGKQIKYRGRRKILFKEYNLYGVTDRLSSIFHLSGNMLNA